MNKTFRWTKDIIRYFVRGSNYDSQISQVGKDTELPENIYGPKIKMGDWVKKQNRVHTWFKTVLLQPGLLLAVKVLGKHLIKEVPDKKWYRNLLIFDKAFENALIDWADLTPLQSPCRTCKSLQGRPAKVVRQMKHLLLTVLMNDTAYFEMFNMLMYNITIEMNKHYDSETVDHLIYYGPSIRDIRYFGIVEGDVLKQIFPTNYPRKK